MSSVNLPSEIIELSNSLNSLPGIGPKLASRIALYLSVSAKDLAKKLESNLSGVISKISKCKICGNVSNSEICTICSDSSRDKEKLIIVEDSLDLISIESTQSYKGLYHVLGGVISPINGIGPDDLLIFSLIERLKDNSVLEVIFALNPNLEGDSTSLYIKTLIDNLNKNILVTKLAKGIPVGADIEYISGQTIVDSVKSRVNF